MSSTIRAFEETRTATHLSGTPSGGAASFLMEKTSVSEALAASTDNVSLSKDAQASLNRQPGSGAPGTDLYRIATQLINDPSATDQQKVDAFAAATYSAYLDRAAGKPVGQAFTNFADATRNSAFMQKVSAVLTGASSGGSALNAEIRTVGTNVAAIQAALSANSSEAVQLSIGMQRNASRDSSAGSSSSQGLAIEVDLTITPELYGANAASAKPGAAADAHPSALAEPGPVSLDPASMPAGTVLETMTMQSSSFSSSLPLVPRAPNYATSDETKAAAPAQAAASPSASPTRQNATQDLAATLLAMLRKSTETAAATPDKKNDLTTAMLGMLRDAFSPRISQEI